MSSIQNFLSEIGKRGLARPNRFEVRISNVDFLPGDVSRILPLLCQSAALPGATILTRTQNLFGPIYVRPTSINYGDTLSMNFLVDKDMLVKNLFDTWIHNVVNMSSFTVNYKDAYARDILISQLDESERATYSVTLVDAFPISMGALSLNQGSNDTFHILPVTFSYRYWSSDVIQQDKSETSIINGPQEKLKEWGPKLTPSRPGEGV